MDNKTINVIGAAAVIAAGTAGTAAAAPASAEPIPAAASYADLLQPVPDAMSRLTADDAAHQNAPAKLFDAQYNPGGPYAHHHHHHHHHHHSRRWYFQHGYIWNGGVWVLRPVRRYHHHHHHHHHY
jgi:hypothetical protein